MANLEYVRWQKKMSYDRMERSIQKIRPGIVSCSHGIIIPALITKDSPMFGWGGVISKEAFVDESKMGDGFGGFYKTAECRHIHKKVVYLGPFIKQWGHFLLDSCSRLWYMLDHDDEVDNYVFCGELNGKNAILNGNYREFLELLGICHKVLIINQPTEFDEVIIPEMGLRKAEFWSEEFGNLYSRAISNALKGYTVENKGKRIFLSRSKLDICTESGNEEMDAYFRLNGFKVVYPEKEKLTSLIRKLYGAEYVASISGSTAHNFLFVDKDCDCIIVEKYALANEYQVGLNLVRTLSVTYIDANICLLPVRPGSGPFIVCCNKYLKSFSEYRGFQVKKQIVHIPKYVHNYWKRYFDVYSIYPEKWIVHDHYDSIKEAYDECMKEYGELISKVTVTQKIKSIIVKYLLKIKQLMEGNPNKDKRR